MQATSFQNCCGLKTTLVALVSSQVGTRPAQITMTASMEISSTTRDHPGLDRAFPEIDDAPAFVLKPHRDGIRRAHPGGEADTGEVERERHKGEIAEQRPRHRHRGCRADAVIER